MGRKTTKTENKIQRTQWEVTFVEEDVDVKNKRFFVTSVVCLLCLYVL